MRLSPSPRHARFLPLPPAQRPGSYLLPRDPNKRKLAQAAALLKEWPKGGDASVENAAPGVIAASGESGATVSGEIGLLKSMGFLGNDVKKFVEKMKSAAEGLLSSTQGSTLQSLKKMLPACVALLTKVPTTSEQNFRKVMATSKGKIGENGDTLRSLLASVVRAGADQDCTGNLPPL